MRNFPNGGALNRWQQSAAASARTTPHACVLNACVLGHRAATVVVSGERCRVHIAIGKIYIIGESGADAPIPIRGMFVDSEIPARMWHLCCVEFAFCVCCRCRSAPYPAERSCVRALHSRPFKSVRGRVVVTATRQCAANIAASRCHTPTHDAKHVYCGSRPPRGAATGDGKLYKPTAAGTDGGHGHRFRVDVRMSIVWRRAQNPPGTT